MFRTIMVHVDDDCADRLDLAVDLAKRFNSSLIGITAGVPRLPIEVYDAGLGGVAVGPEFSTFDREHLKAEFGKLAETFKQATAGAGIETDWLAYFEAPSVAVARAATSADLIILGTGDTSLLGNLALASAGDVVLHTGRPVLVVPKGCRKLALDKVIIAWKDTAEAQRAISDALPFLKQAGSVVVFGVASTETTDDAALAAPLGFLVRHDIAATSEVVPHGNATVEDEVLNYAVKARATLVVAGAYGHSRMREWVFGGVTRGLLTRSHIPTLFSH
jgi:nucleotide-binding universal stress UspA family protein